MPKFHARFDGQTEPCKARKHCTYGAIEGGHYPTAEMAERAYILKHTEESTIVSLATRKVLSEIGPRQLPNRSWVTLSNALYENLFSEYTLNHALTTVSCEWEKLSAVTSKRLSSWGPAERDAAKGLAELAYAASELSKLAEAFETSNDAKLRYEFPSQYAA